MAGRVLVTPRGPGKAGSTRAPGNGRPVGPEWLLEEGDLVLDFLTVLGLGLARQVLPERLDGLLLLALLLVGVAEVVPGIGVVRVGGGGLHVPVDGLGVLVQLAPGAAQLVEDGGAARVRLEGLLVG